MTADHPTKHSASSQDAGHYASVRISARHFQLAEKLEILVAYLPRRFFPMLDHRNTRGGGRFAITISW
jgi:hypothetical protein